MRTRIAVAIAVIAGIMTGCWGDPSPRNGVDVEDDVALPSVESSRPAYAKMQEFKAMAINDGTLAFTSVGQCSPAKAAADALAECQRLSNDSTCRLSAIGNSDVTGLDPLQIRDAIRRHALSVTNQRPGPTPSTVEIPVVLLGDDVPGLRGLTAGRLIYDPNIPCVNAVAAETSQGLTCEGVSQFRRRVGSAAYPAEGDLDFRCSNGIMLFGTYLTIFEGVGAALVTDEAGRKIAALYGPDVSDGVASAPDFRRLWSKRAAVAPDARIFQEWRPPD